MGNYCIMNFTVLVGKTLKSVFVDNDSDEIIFTTDNDEVYKLYHSQDCCENVVIDDVCGDVQDLIGTPIIVAEERESDEAPSEVSQNEDYYKDDSETWTFYELRTVKGSVTIRWHGSSNGYYSESVDFCRVDSVGDNND